MIAVIERIECHLPDEVETGAKLAAEFPAWRIQEIEEKTGISERHVAAAGECASDLAAAAARKLFDSGACTAADIDFILFCTQTPDYLLPTTACLLQDRLGVPTSAGALDFNLGSSGYVYGLALAQGLIEKGNARRVLLLTADTYSKLIHPADKSVRTIFGDAAAATLVSGMDAAEPALGPFVFGSDGRGGRNLMVPASALRVPRSPETSAVTADSSGNLRTAENLFMDGGEIFAFTLRAVPKLARELLERAGRKQEEIDLFVLHQPNRIMLNTLRRQMRIPEDRFYIHLAGCGNTASASIPLALAAARDDGRLRPGSLVMLVGFGGGYSWAATLVRWVG